MNSQVSPSPSKISFFFFFFGGGGREITSSFFGGKGEGRGEIPYEQRFLSAWLLVFTKSFT